jgi:hypothetical protein
VDVLVSGGVGGEGGKPAVEVRHAGRVLAVRHQKLFCQAFLGV